MDTPYFTKEHLWLSASDEAALKKVLVKVNPPQYWPRKQNGTTVVAAVMVFEVANNWRSMLQIYILKRTLEFEL